MLEIVAFIKTDAQGDQMIYFRDLDAVLARSKREVHRETHYIVRRAQSGAG